MPDFEKLSIILTIENPQLLRISPQLIEMSQNQENELSNNNQVRITPERFKHTIWNK